MFGLEDEDIGAGDRCIGFFWLVINLFRGKREHANQGLFFHAVHQNRVVRQVQRHTRP